MRLRFKLRSPFGPSVVRDVADGLWQESTGSADQTLGEGMWALPGLVDAHAHVASDELFTAGNLDEAIPRVKEALKAGVTLLLDKGWTDDVAIRVIDQVPADERPEMEAAGRVIASVGGYYPDFALEVDGSQLASAVANEATSGRGWVKLVGDWPRRGVGPQANFTESELATAVETAAEQRAKVAIHTMARDVPSMAVAAGIHSIEHGLFLTEDDIQALGARRGMWVPTILRAEATRDQLGEDSSGGRLLGEGVENVRRLLRPAVDAGVHVLAGTDLVGSPANIGAEALKLAEYGLDNGQALAAVSSDGFVATERAADFAVGASADVVLFDQDPLSDLGVLAHPKYVLRRGQVRWP